MLFDETTNDISIRTEDDLQEIVNHLRNFTFPEKTTSKIHEVFCAYIFIVGCYKMNRLQLPISITCRESPDFEYYHKSANHKIGIEHTRATQESFKIAESEFKKHPEGSLIELCHYSPFENIPKLESDKGIIHPNDDLKGVGWGDNQTEQEWAEIMLNAIRSKTGLLNKPHFEIRSKNVLFVEDDSPVDFVKDDEKAIPLLRHNYSQTCFKQRTFDSIHILTNCVFIYDVFGECLRTSMKKMDMPNGSK
ncbi:MAG: hypothetical protein JW787_05265 [Sedimentisphaerales bacterium]|nr:hypothetical protein [Sedimentisphaerales bacterium]